MREATNCAFSPRASERSTVSADLCPCDFRGHFAAFLSRALKSSEPTPTAPPFHSISCCVKILLSFIGEGEEHSSYFNLPVCGQQPLRRERAVHSCIKPIGNICIPPLCSSTHRPPLAKESRALRVSLQAFILSPDNTIKIW